jgi:hypothetical protein
LINLKVEDEPMKVIAAKVLALGGLCVLFAGVSNGAIAQGYEHREMDHGHGRPMVSQAHRRLQKLHTVYAREINHGNRAAAERAHLKAKAIRARLRAHRHQD